MAKRRYANRCRERRIFKQVAGSARLYRFRTWAIVIDMRQVAVDSAEFEEGVIIREPGKAERSVHAIELSPRCADGSAKPGPAVPKIGTIIFGAEGQSCSRRQAAKRDA